MNSRSLERLHDLREARRAEGLCKDCDAEAVAGRKHCAEHLRYHRQLKRELRSARIAAGVCVTCSGAREGVAQNCDACRARASRAQASFRHLRRRRRRGVHDPAKMNVYRANFVAGRRSELRCVRCSAPSPVGRYLCRDCTDEAVADGTERSGERRAAGLCKCGRTPRPGMAQCERCAERARSIAARDRARRAAAGQCRQCRSPTAPGSPYCVEHRRASTEAQRRFRGRKKAVAALETVKASAPKEAKR